MSVTTTAPGGPTAGTARDVPGRGARTRLPRPRRSTLVVLAGLVLAVLVVVLLGGGARTGDPLDPDNPGPEGAQAVARVLEDDGVDVDVARGAAELASADLGPGTTLLVVSPDLLGGGALTDLLDTAPGTRLVVAGAGSGPSGALGLAPPARTASDRPVAASCDDALLGGLEVAVDGAWAYDLPGCFEVPDGALVATTEAGGTDLLLLGADDVLTNDQVLRADNAAVALRLLGQEQRLVWFVPSLTDLTGEDGVGLRTLLPRWIEPGLFVLGLAAAGLVLWRGRRLGPLAAEPLPVVVRAAETTHSLGRLYRRSGDRGHAARSLRAAARRRAARRLRLGRGADPVDVVRAVARHLGRPEPEVAALLAPDAPAPASDEALVTLAADLAALDREVAPR